MSTSNRQAVLTFCKQGLGQAPMVSRITQRPSVESLAGEAEVRGSGQSSGDAQALEARAGQLWPLSRSTSHRPVSRRRHLVGDPVLHRLLRVGNVGPLGCGESLWSSRALSTARLGSAVSGDDLARQDGQSPHRCRSLGGRCRRRQLGLRLNHLASSSFTGGGAFSCPLTENPRPTSPTGDRMP
jgi:hypothetical protein